MRATDFFWILKVFPLKTELCKKKARMPLVAIYTLKIFLSKSKQLYITQL